jgi:hypothetical protein
MSIEGQNLEIAADRVAAGLTSPQDAANALSLTMIQKVEKYITVLTPEEKQALEKKLKLQPNSDSKCLIAAVLQLTRENEKSAIWETHPSYDTRVKALGVIPPLDITHAPCPPHDPAEGPPPPPTPVVTQSPSAGGVANQAPALLSAPLRRDRSR